jgi:hypothetical protein
MFKLGGELWVVENSISGEIYLETLSISKDDSISSLTQYHDHHEPVGSKLYLDAHKGQDGYYRDEMKKWVDEQDFLVCHKVSLVKSNISK